MTTASKFFSLTTVFNRSADPAEGTVVCPACLKPLPPGESLVAGVCPRCKSGLATMHGKILNPGFQEETAPAGHHIKERARFDDHGERVATSEDSFEESILQRFCQELGCNAEYGLEALALAAELLDNHKSGDIAPVMRMFKRGLRIVRCSRGLKEMSEKLEYFILSLRWFDELDGVNNPTALARKLHVTKQNSNKYVNLFRDVMPPGMQTLPAMPGQLQEGARKKSTNICHQRHTSKHEKKPA